VEGGKLRVSIVARDIADAEYKFRVNSVKITPGATGDTVDLDGYLDYPKFWIETTTQVYKDKTSNAVLAQIAQNVGLEYEGDVTSDTQTWQGAKRRVHAFCSAVANHGLSSQTSCMKLAVCLDGKMRYKDVSKLETANPKAQLLIGDIRTGYLTVVSHLPKNSGGSANRKSGYKQTMLEYSTIRSETYRTHTNVMADINEGGAFNMNARVRAEVNAGSHNVAPIDYGNVHDDYHRAKYQNRRGTALFNVGLDVLINMPAISQPYIRVFDTVTVTAPEEQSEQNGAYIVVSHAVMITNGQYHEKLELTRRSAASEQAKSESDSEGFESTSSELYKDNS
jgi:hypothetical protein